MQKKILIAAFVLGLVIFFVNRTAMAENLYVAISWLDVPMHFLGGLFSTLIVAGFALGRIASLSRRKGFFYILGGTLLIGLMWEWFEYFILYKSLGGGRPGQGLDIFADLFFDVLGGIVIAYFVSLRQKTYNERNGR